MLTPSIGNSNTTPTIPLGDAAEVFEYMRLFACVGDRSSYRSIDKTFKSLANLSGPVDSRFYETMVKWNDRLVAEETGAELLRSGAPNNLDLVIAASHSTVQDRAELLQSCTVSETPTVHDDSSTT